MLPRLYRFPFAPFTVALAVGLCPARADDANTVKEKLIQAKKVYDEEVATFRKGITDLLDKREDDARKAGNKKLLDQVKAERTAFEQSGELPAVYPVALQNQMKIARASFDKAYSVAVKDLVRLKQDAEAEAVEKAQQEFASDSALLFGKRTYVSTLKASDIKVWNSAFEKDTSKYKQNGRAVPHSVFMHPDFRNVASVSYTLSGKSLVFRAAIGVPKHEEGQGDPASPLTFEVMGDGKSLWKSEPVTKLDTFQTCVVKVEKVKTLTLRVHCPEAHGGAHAVWFEPILAE